MRAVRRVGLAKTGSLSFWGQMGIEFVAIVAAVVLGFMVNEWRENRVRARAVEGALVNLAQEMLGNHQALERTFAYHSEILERIAERARLQEALPAGQRRIGYGHELPGWRGVRLPMLRSSTFQMLVSSGAIADLPFAQADRLALIYNYQSVMEKLDDAHVVRFANDPGVASLETIRHAFALYLEITPSLLGLYQEIGRPILAAHGYDLSVENEVLNSSVELAMQDYRANEVSRRDR